MIIKYIVLIFGTIFEVYSTGLYISSFLSRKSLKYSKLVIAYFAILLFQVIASFTSKGIVLLICSFITAFCICCIYKSKLYAKLILAITAVVINVASEMIASGFIMLSNTIDFDTINSDPYLYALGTLISKFIMYILILIICLGKFKFNVDNIEFKHLLILSVLPMTTVSMIILMYQVMFLITNTKLKLMFVISSVFVILSNMITFYIINRQNRMSKAEYELNLLKKNINEQTKHYINLQASHDEIRQLRHNMRSICIATIAELEAGNFDNAIEQLKCNINIIEKTNKVIDTGHPSIDTIIENKIERCNVLNIGIDISYQYKEKININEIDVAVIIGNILDNAIEACQKNEDKDKEIWGTVTVDKQNIIINIKNTAINFNDFKTLKSNKKEHGYGLKSITHIANKHNGYTKFDFEENIFTSYVVLQN